MMTLITVFSIIAAAGQIGSLGKIYLFLRLIQITSAGDKYSWHMFNALFVCTTLLCSNIFSFSEIISCMLFSFENVVHAQVDVSGVKSFIVIDEQSK